MQANLSNITIVLKGPKFPGNVGSAARCAMNMGLSKMIVVGNRNLDDEAVRQMATHVAKDIVNGIRHFDTLDEALAGFTWIVGTTARQGSGRGPVVTPRRMAETIVGLSQDNEIALLFGPEDTGLTNDDLRFCQTLVTIPTVGFKSLNLSHAVMVLCYELLVARMDPSTPAVGKLASSRELEGMYIQLKATLQAIGFLNPENPDYWMMHIRRLFARTTLFAREVKILRGICRQIEWYGDHKVRRSDPPGEEAPGSLRAGRSQGKEA
ncbi:MAG: RNA methyltransferase [Deltaproteobacteria bacterium]|nr:RNA methyltransferase [Deltaproteobacteria bacterium]